MPPTATLRALNALDRETFVDVLGSVFEHSPDVAAGAWAARPFATVADLHAAMVAVVRDFPMERQLALLRAHPDLAGKAARAGAMTASSVAEQAAAGLDRLSDDQYARFHRLNAAYRDTFGFPFIIAVRHHDAASILAAFEDRLGHAREVELAAALAQVAEIARLRLASLVVER